MVEEVDALVARVGKHPVWGYGHCVWVHSLAEELARAERLSYDAESLRVAALLHDVGLYKAYAMREPAQHAKRSPAVAQGILNDADFPSQAARTAIEAIEAHPPGHPPGHPLATCRAPRPAPARRPPSSSTPSPWSTSASSASPEVSRVPARVGTEDDVADLRA